MWFPHSLLSNFVQHLRENRAAWEKRKWASDCVFEGGVHSTESVNGILFSVGEEFVFTTSFDHCFKMPCYIFFTQVITCVILFIIHIKFNKCKNSKTN